MTDNTKSWQRGLELSENKRAGANKMICSMNHEVYTGSTSTFTPSILPSIYQRVQEEIKQTTTTVPLDRLKEIYMWYVTSPREMCMRR